MILSELLKRLYDESEFTSIDSLSKLTGIDKGFINRAFTGKHTMERLDPLFEELTIGLTVDEFISCIQLIKRIKSNIIEQEQIL